ncbi:MULTISPECIES: LPXTG cell wall anchor domain-containing protein [unclassified Microbacterium]|uniref:DUF7927 domain-containing protein n=1 Tax=unclassified Microbacterium TaxID=2609290 RepID=UPI000EA88CED|nr:MULTISPECIES: LPXTG cell wall anchor domain-containing protein [unclassified Microbacterium]MBT2484394.1 DUF11 domain-containing protein [Microbacterium sp. ISL-108]RKN67305.1 DUF11 domain-containing protein [Microbacterium sp. CGR2]
MRLKYRDGRARPSWIRKAGSLLATGALVASGLAVATATLAAPPAQAEENVPGVPAGFETTFYAYMEAGDSLDVSFTKAFTNDDGGYAFSVIDPTGTVAWSCSITEAQAVGTTCAIPDLTGPAGAWTIVQDQTTTSGGSSFDWNITVSNSADVAQTGRVWTNNYGAYQTDGVQTRDLSYTVLNDTGYRYAVNLNDYNGIGSRIIANSLGLTGPDGEPLYESGPAAGINPALTSPPYRIFFEEPSAALPATAPSAEGTLTVAPPLLTPAELAVDDLAFTPSSVNSGSGTFSYSINERFSGAYNLQVDTNGNGSYDDAVDRTIRLGADGSGEYTYDFDGLDGEGNVVADCTLMNARIFFDQLGEFHLLQVDVEGRTGGLEIIRLNGSAAAADTIYWNDTNLEATTGPRANTTPVLDGTAGVASTGGVHGWANNGNSWGNNRTIDDWTYDPIALAAGEIQIGGRCLDIEKTSDADADTRVGDTVTYTVTATNTGVLDYTEATPATVTDDLAGVLDDATYNTNASSDLPGTVVYEEPKISWTGALPAGETVSITYTVTLVAGGDGAVRNVAFSPPPGITTTPVCDPPDADGLDPETGIPCAENEFELPRLTVEKTSDVADLPADGGEVTYEVTVTNAGPGVYTEDAPAMLTDDLSDVLDDAEFGSIVAPATGAEFDEATETLTWSGPLGVGESVTISYTVTYDSTTGDNVLLNVACVPEGETAPGAESCDTVRIPAAALEVTKSVDPASGTTVAAGETLTYTLSFISTGETAATIDKVDDLADVLDDAELVAGSIVTSNPALTAELTGTDLAITGSVPAGETYTVTYSVRVNQYPEQANHILANVVQNPDGTCDVGGCPETENPIRHFSIEKSSDTVEGVQTSDVVTYTVTLTNDGEGAYTDDVPAGMTDDLTDVLDDAAYNGDAEAVASDGSQVPAPTFSTPVLAWSGPLAVGESVSITYTVTVTNQGDADLVNVAGPVCGPEEVCDPTPPVEIPLPRITPTKSSDPATGSDVVAGQVVTYTVTFTNDGQAAGDVAATDDLSSVLDDAELTDGPTTDVDAISAEFDSEAQTLRVEGPLAAGATVTVTYQVTVLPDGERGDNFLTNVVTSDTPPYECDPADTDCDPFPPPTTEHQIGELDDWKTVDPASGSTVRAGQVVTYTLHFENTGEAPVSVDREDVLTKVLDDATVTSQPASSDAALTPSAVEGERFSITGSLAAGQVVTVTYQVTVNADGARGDDQLGNFLVDTGEVPPTECVPEDTERPDCTVNYVSNVAVTKSANPTSGTEVEQGQEVTYTLTFRNVSTNPAAADADVDYTDHMADVLDDATLTQAPQASAAALTATASGQNIRIVGALASGETVTVTYGVTVKDWSAQGNHSLGNVVAVSGEEPICVDGNELCTSHPLTEPEGLAITGGEVAAWVVITGLMLLVGGGALMMARRRREEIAAVESID